MQGSGSRRSPGDDRSGLRRRALRVMGVAAGLVVVLLWPIQSIVVLMLLASVVLAVDLYERWTHRHTFGARRRASFRQAISAATFVFLAAGLVAAVMWSTPMVFIALGIVAATCTLSCAVTSLVWLVAMEHDLTDTPAHPHPPVQRQAAASRTRRPRPVGPIASLPEPHQFRV